MEFDSIANTDLSADNVNKLASTTTSGDFDSIPENFIAPSITTVGAFVGEQLNAFAGYWAGNPSAFTFAFQWQRSADGVSGWADISGATGASYVLAALDQDKSLRVGVVATNTVGSGAVAYSDTTDQIQPSTALPLILPVDRPTEGVDKMTYHLPASMAGKRLLITAGHKESTGLAPAIGNDTSIVVREGDYSSADNGAWLIDVDPANTGTVLTFAKSLERQPPFVYIINSEADESTITTTFVGKNLANDGAVTATKTPAEGSSLVALTTGFGWTGALPEMGGDWTQQEPINTEWAPSRTVVRAGYMNNVSGDPIALTVSGESGILTTMIIEIPQ